MDLPVDSMFAFCSHGRSLREAEVSCGGDVRAALRATLIANAYLEAEIERLTEAISTGFARGRMRKAPQRGMKKI